MKKILSLGIAAIAMLASCAKQEVNNDTIELTHQVSFNIENFQKDVIGFPTKSNAKVMSVNATAAVVGGADLKTYTKSISYVIFNDKGVKVKDSVQTDTDKNFGKINVQLRDGVYKMVIAAGTGKFAGAQTALFLNGISYLGEQFYKQIDFTVASKDANYDATLSRMGAKLVVKLTQEWPASVKNVTLKMNVNDRLNFATLKGENSLGTAYPEYVFGEKAASKLVESSWFTALFPTETASQTATLTAYGSNNEVLYQRTIDKIQLEHNKITTLTGNLFTSKISGFEIKIDAEWAGTIDQTF